MNAANPTPRTTPARPSVLLNVPHDLAESLRAELNPRTTTEHILVRQAIWAAAQLMFMTTDAPAQPDAAWLRLYNTADRTFHRNLRELRRLRARNTAETSAPAPAVETPANHPADPASTAPAPPAAPAPTTPKERIAPRPGPKPSRTPGSTPSDRRDHFRKLVARLESELPLAQSLLGSIPPSDPLPFSATG